MPSKQQESNILFSGALWAGYALEYLVDGFQRSLLFWDVLRKRGNNYLEHVSKGQPPVLTFNYEVILDGRDMQPQVNFALVHVLGQRTPGRHARTFGAERRKDPAPHKEQQPEDAAKRPVVIIDPRAGHGPGIAGTRQDSQVGNALSEGHPVYFIIFFPEPAAGQTLLDVHNAVAGFIDEVGRRHPEAGQPMIIGNCQAGWATAIIGADMPEITGPLVLNGAPMSFWASIEGKNPMSYRAGLLGGVWVTSFLSDVGAGKFDGANLVANFEDLNPANTLWSKQYNLYSRIDTEEERYLKFEKWWSGFFLLSDKEIHFIIDNLFIGNKLESGNLELTPEKRIDLCDIEEPVLLFSSKGDNITPPHQALNWIKEVYGSVEEIVRQEKVLVYMVHEKVGHLGIFVSRSVAAKEHQEIIGNIELLRYLPPGLYEMIIEEGTDIMDGGHRVRFEERCIEDLLLHDGKSMHSHSAFQAVSALSRVNDRIYRSLFRPWVRMCFQEPLGEISRQAHPQRLQRSLCSDLNPMLWPVKLMAPVLKEQRILRSADNPFVQWEREFSRTVEESLELFREIRDSTQELVFRLFFENPFFQAMFSEAGPESPASTDPLPSREVDALPGGSGSLSKRMEKGGVIEGTVRAILAVINADQLIYTHELEHLHGLMNREDSPRAVDPEELINIISEQSQLLRLDEEAALKALPALLPAHEDRLEVFTLATELAYVNFETGVEEAGVLQRLKQILKI